MIEYIYLAYVVVVVSVLSIYLLKRFRVDLYSDGVVIRDAIYPLQIPIYVIRSVVWCDTTPRIVGRLCAYSGLRRCKGMVVGSDKSSKTLRVIMYIEALRTPCIKIETTTKPIYINFKDVEETRELFYAIQRDLHLVKETELEPYRVFLYWRRSVIIGVVVALLLLLPAILLF